MAATGPVVLTRLADLTAGLADLVLPSACAGCGAERVRLRYATCPACVAALEALSPFAACPVPVPAGMPPCVAMGPYADVLRGALLGYKERGRHALARPLGALLAAAVAEVGGAAGGQGRVPLVVVPVPSTARAARQRHGDHLARLAAHAVRRLRAAGWQAQLMRPLRASPRPDSASLDAGQRAAVAVNSLRITPAGIRGLQRCVTVGGVVVVVDDIVTTGSTLAAVTTRLASVNVHVAGAAVLAATQLRRVRPTGPPGLPPRGIDWANRHKWVP